jgi:hypothetical protein
MTRRDQELLEKQLWGVSSRPRQNGIIDGLTIVAVFLAGIVIGDILFAQQSTPVQITSHDAIAMISSPKDAQSLMR